MTREEKINWLENATAEQVINQLKWSVISMTSGHCIETRIEGQEDYDLITVELMKRLEK